MNLYEPIVRKDEVKLKAVKSYSGDPIKNWTKWLEANAEFRSVYGDMYSIVLSFELDKKPKITPVKSDCGQFIGITTKLKTKGREIELTVLKYRKSKATQFIAEDDLMPILQIGLLLENREGAV
jgi:hypothetical protein